MWHRVKQFWTLANEKPRFRAGYVPVESPVWRIWSRYMIKPAGVTVLLIILGNMTWGFGMYVTAGTVAYLGEHVVEIGLMDRTDRDAPAATFDPTAPGERRRFFLPEPATNASLAQLAEQRVGKSVPEKLRLLAWLAGLLIAFELARMTLRFWWGERAVVVTQRMAYRLRQDIHDKLHQLPLSYHDRHSPGRLVTHLFTDVDAIKRCSNMLIKGMPMHIAQLVCGAVIVVVIEPWLGALLLVALPPYALAFRFFRSKLTNVSRTTREREGLLNAYVANRVSHYRLVKAFRRETIESAAFARKAAHIAKLGLADTVLTIGFMLVISTITAVALTSVVWLAALQVRDGNMSVAGFLFFHASAAALFHPINMIATEMTMVFQLRVAASKVVRVLDEPISLDSPAKPARITDAAPAVRFESLTMTYPRSDRPALDSLDLVIPAGTRLAVMGESGSGKSTLAKLAIRLYDPTQGRVTIDGVDLRDFDLKELRKHISYVAQESVVFSGTIGQNIRYGTDQANHNDVTLAAQHAQIHDFIVNLPERYRTLTHERGLTLSGGQKQRVNLARALLQQPKFLVLDDCTSALDAETEARLVHAFEHSLRSRTVMLITHRVSIASKCDQVVYMENGRIVEQGSPAELLAKDSRFHETYRRQMGMALSAS